MDDQELRDLIAANSRAISRLETLQAHDREQLLLSREQWREELEASRKQSQEERDASAKQSQEERDASAKEWREKQDASAKEWREKQDASAREWQEKQDASAKEWQEKLDASRKQWQEELAASRREHDRMLASLERSMEYASRQLAKIGIRTGERDEAAFYPSLERVLSEGFHMEVIAPNVVARRQGEELELDVLAYANEDVNTVFDVEIKTELDQEALDQILDHLRRFPRFFREHRGKKLYGVLAAVKIPPGMRKRALRHGLFLATIRDDVFDVLRPAGFEPRAFPN